MYSNELSKQMNRYLLKLLCKANKFLPAGFLYKSFALYLLFFKTNEP